MDLNPTIGLLCKNKSKGGGETTQCSFPAPTVHEEFVESILRIRTESTDFTYEHLSFADDFMATSPEHELEPE